jgi:hypothetical protein
MSLAKRLLNHTEGFDFLTLPVEQKELKYAGVERVTLRRTFNMTFDGVTLKFWRVTGPATHPNYQSDLSIDGLKEWEII